MRVTFLTTDEPLYLPRFFQEALDALSGDGHEFTAAIVPPIYKGTTKRQLMLRYFKVFGPAEFLRLSAGVAWSKLMDRLGMSGRGGRWYSLEGFFKDRGVPHFALADMNSPEGLAAVRETKPDLLVSVSCPQIFGRELAGSAPLGCLNLHGSILPDYRGVMPSFWMLANGEKKAGVTLFFVNDKIDAGDILVQRVFDIRDDDTLDSFIRRSKSIGAESVVEGIKKVAEGGYETRPIDCTKGRYFGWPDGKAVGRFRAAGRKFA